MKTFLATSFVVGIACTFATALAYVLGARGHAFHSLSLVTWGLSIPTACLVAGLSLIMQKSSDPQA
ncbi:MAG TPA: hypothetical protein VG734_10440 [Lacunisphaera sp.]|nr:hypothetical protein [Lacunisphaera sp.]